MGAWRSATRSICDRLFGSSACVRRNVEQTTPHGAFETDCLALAPVYGVMSNRRGVVPHGALILGHSDILLWKSAAVSLLPMLSLTPPDVILPGWAAQIP